MAENGWFTGDGGGYANWIGSFKFADKFGAHSLITFLELFHHKSRLTPHKKYCHTHKKNTLKKMFFKMKYEVPKESEGSPMMCISKQALSDCCVFQDAQGTAPFNGHKCADTPEFSTSL